MNFSFERFRVIPLMLRKIQLLPHRGHLVNKPSGFNHASVYKSQTFTVFFHFIRGVIPVTYFHKEMVFNPCLKTSSSTQRGFGQHIRLSKKVKTFGFNHASVYKRQTSTVVEKKITLIFTR